MTKLFVGMPVYNGDRFISLAIDSLLNQTFTDWLLLISDNASDDETETVCKRYCLIDSRIKYHRQEQNIGAVANFKFLLDKASSEYFMWAAADDVWGPEFLSTCIANLDRDSTFGMAFCNIVNIDTFGRVIRTYPDFSKFVLSSHFLSVSRFLLDPEIQGKANLFYSLYRTEQCRKAWNASPRVPRWGFDMCFVLAAIVRSKLIIDKRIMFYKRLIRLTDVPIKVDEIKDVDTKWGGFPIEYANEYQEDNLTAVKGTKFFWLTFVLMKFRIFARNMHRMSTYICIYVRNVKKLFKYYKVPKM